MLRHNLFLASLLAGLWLANSGHYTPLLLGFGALSVGFTLWLANRMDVVDKEAQPVHITTRLPLYWAWLVGQIILANADVVKRIWLGTSAIDPKVVDLPIRIENDVLRVTYANSITLTPGTVTLEITEERVSVHALTASGALALEQGGAQERAARLES